MTYIDRHNSAAQSSVISLVETAPMSACALLLEAPSASRPAVSRSALKRVSVASTHSAHSCWTGRTGKDYLLEPCTREALFAKDDQVILLAKQSDHGESVLWVGHMRDLFDDPSIRLSFRSALEQMDHAYITNAPRNEDALHILVWDLEKAMLNLSVHAA